MLTRLYQIGDNNMDIERAKSIKMSSEWEDVCKELDVWILAELNKTRTCDIEALKKIQSRISAFEEVKDLPQIIIDREA